MVLPLAHNVKHGAGSALTEQRLPLPAVTLGVFCPGSLSGMVAKNTGLGLIRDPFISPAHLTKLERWLLRGGGGLLHHVAFFNIWSQWQD